MCVEIETKLKITSFDNVIERLNQLGAKFIADCRQLDSYFDDADAALVKSDKALRLRRQLTGDTEKIFLAYKGPKQPGNVKKRREIETEIANAEPIEKILSALGYNKVLVVEKKRSLYQLGDCEIALDEVIQLGNFVEIEGPDDNSIEDAKQKLALTDLPHIKETYAHLMEKKLRNTQYASRNTNYETR